MWTRSIQLFVVAALLHGCSGVEEPTLSDDVGDDPVPTVQDGPLDIELRALIATHELTGDPSTGRNLPSINDPLAQLGRKLFFTKALGGELDSACVSCHHPVLGGADALSLSVGIGAIDPDLLGPGRGDENGVPNVPRNAPTTFNIGMWDSALFMDSRIASLGAEIGQNGSASGISTPDSALGVIDNDAGENLAVAQTRFPVTSVEEMRGALEDGESNDVLRKHLAARLGDYGVGSGELNNSTWLQEFQTAFQSAESAESLISFDNIAIALATYERSQVFVDNPWKAYVDGNNDAISDNAKEGAILFFSETNEDGGGCFECHAGDLFTDEEHHAIAAPQFGPGKGSADNGLGDFGRENISGEAIDRFRFRTPSLLNIAATAPYTHTGAYETLQQILQHYDNPRDEVDDFFDDGGWCELEQFEDVIDCENLYPGARQNTIQALNKIDDERDANDPQALPNINLNNNDRDQIVAFLQTLTDPCVESRLCLSPWIPTANEAADDHQINAVNINGNAL